MDRFPAIAKGIRKPFVEKRREVYLKLGRKTEVEADDPESKGGTGKWKEGAMCGTSAMKRKVGHGATRPTQFAKGCVPVASLLK